MRKYFVTRMHSSRMRTIRYSGRLSREFCQSSGEGGGRSAFGQGEGFLPLVQGGVCLWSGGCLPLVRGVSASGLGGVSASGPGGQVSASGQGGVCLWSGGVSASGPGGCLPPVGGVCLWSGGGVSASGPGWQVSASGPERVSARHPPPCGQNS